ncbi:MAG TPA: acyloxyacyl hydrolase [Microvirga sp.]|jgi:hypothetical protein
MRVGPIVGLSLLIVGATGTGAVAAETGKRARPNAVPAAERPSLLSEFRFGFSAQDPWGPETGSGNVTGELLLAKPFTAADLFTSYFIPRPHIGGSLNFGDRTSFAYAGLTWSVDITPRVFVEGSFGGAVHNGSTSPYFTPPNRQALGCSPLFRESGSIGVKLAGNWSLLATVEHLSNGGSCAENRGLTNIGARLGYSF